MFEAYKVAVSISLINSASSVIQLLTGQFRGLGKDVDATKLKVSELESRLNGLKKLGLAGGALFGLGALGLGALKGPLDEARKYQTELAKFSALGFGDAVNLQADKFATGMNVMGSSATDNMRLIREASAIMGSFEHAKEAAPLLAKMKFGIEAVMGGGRGGNFETMFQAAIKTSELRGALVNRDTGQIDMGKFGNSLNMMTQAYVASGGLVKPQDYLAAMKTGGVSAKLMKDESFFFGLGHFMQESGGSRTGTASMSMFQNWAMGGMSQRAAERMAADGLLNPAAIHYGRTGHITKVDAMGMKNADQFIENPFAYVNNTMVPMLKKLGYSGEKLNIELAQLLGIRTARNLADQFVREEKVANLYVERSKKAANIGGLYNVGAGTMDGQMINFHKQWESLLKELGTAILPAAITGVKYLSGLIIGVKNAAAEFPTITKAAIGLFAVISGAAIAGGSLALAKAGFGAIGVALGGAGQAAGLIGLLGTATMWIGGVGIAGTFGGAIGALIYSLNEGTPQMETFGRGIAKVLAFFGNKEAQESLDVVNRGNNAARPTLDYVRPGGGAGRGFINNTIVMPNGQVLAKVVTQVQSKEMARPATGGRLFDPSVSVRMIQGAG